MSGTAFLVAMLLACAFGVGAVVGGYFLLSGPFPTPDVADAVTSATTMAETPLPVAPDDDGSWTDADIRGCKEEATRAAEVAKRRRLAAVSEDRVGLGGPDPGIVERATYLLCGATHKPLHLCQNYWRSWFIKAIKAYAKEFRDVATSSYWTKVHVAERARRDAEGQGEWQTITDDLDQTTREVAMMHEDIVAAFRSLIVDGIISPAEFSAFFGFGIPTEIRKMIGDAQPLRERCE
jgi:hypothetical protein